jgi:uncharacterized membrane protein HdeD (DUF308 family)
MSAKLSTVGWIEEAKKGSRWIIVLGLIQILIGIVAIASPMITGLAVTAIVGALLLINGIFQIIQAFKSGSWGVGVMAFLGGAFAVICGILVLFDPLRGLAALTLVLAVYFVVDGIQQIVLAFRLRPVDGWGWMFFGGLLSLLLGVFIWRRWPLSGVWAIGTLVGIHILYGGWTMVAIAMAARRVADHLAGERAS